MCKRSWGWKTGAIRKKTAFYKKVFYIAGCYHKYIIMIKSNKLRDRSEKGKIMCMSGVEYALSTLYTCMKMALGNLITTTTIIIQKKLRSLHKIYHFSF